ncbi:Ctr copper transporter family-containing protein [Strongyloides ratti]|uniref:Copper transport protein n=1 Tax=Strongyloides ratti TaxID=34506 RepID=A0A090KZD7_STRRB|nr:Ctr copper transporter family-containing protein [Strongyloides ratti]CEF61197.1 Ctr copper transporter family-containing protein [Strongyloides ratti]
MMNMGNHPMMKMYFHFRINDVILFENWVPHDTFIYIISCIIVFILAFGFETLRSYRMLLLKKEMSSKKCCRADVLNITSNISQIPTDEPPECDCNIIDDSMNGYDNKIYKISNFPVNIKVLSSKYHYFQTLLYFIQMFWAYSLMLICMTYNVPLVLSVILGHSTAYIILSPFSNTEMEEKVGDCCN